jgi:hypothetical protein
MLNKSVSPINSLTAIFSISILLRAFIMELGRPPLETRKRGIPDLNKTREWWFG